MLVKTIGQVAGIGTGDGSSDESLTFTIDEIKVDAKCTEQFASKPENGHLIAVKMTIKTTAQYDPADFITMTGYDFSIVGPDGITESSLTTVATYSCFKEALMLDAGNMSKSSQYGGYILLDSKNAHGALLFRPSAIRSEGGWEWAF